MKYNEGLKGDKTGGRNYLGVCDRTQGDDLEWIRGCRDA